MEQSDVAAVVQKSCDSSEPDGATTKSATTGPKSDYKWSDFVLDKDPAEYLQAQSVICDVSNGMES